MLAVINEQGGVVQGYIHPAELSSTVARGMVSSGSSSAKPPSLDE